MKADLLEPCGACEAMLDSNATVARSPLRALLARFPAVSQAALSLVDQAIVSGASFVTAMIIARTTSQVTMGMYYLIASIVIVAVGVQEHIIAAPYIIYSKRRSGNELAVYQRQRVVASFLDNRGGRDCSAGGDRRSFDRRFESVGCQLVGVVDRGPADAVA
jgi:hypothetical protein